MFYHRINSNLIPSASFGITSMVPQSEGRAGEKGTEPKTEGMEWPLLQLPCGLLLVIYILAAQLLPYTDTDHWSI